MNIDKLIDDAIESYDAYLRYCNHLAVEAQRYIALMTMFLANISMA